RGWRLEVLLSIAAFLCPSAAKEAIKKQMMPDPNDVTEAEGNVTTYLEGFIEALKLSEERSKERLIAQKLQKIQDAIKSCVGWMEQDWEPMEEDFLSKLEYLLRFLNHNALPKETA
uniref:Uncharacterized protein n=1 Tax=Aquila chrysaetos chrysaetos TaxID=223781 RepID=A0A663F3T3_AQUCH